MVRSGHPLLLTTAADYLRSVVLGECAEATDHRDALASLDRQSLEYALDSDSAKIAFWLNLYNAFTQPGQVSFGVDRCPPCHRDYRPEGVRDAHEQELVRSAHPDQSERDPVGRRH